MFSLRDFPFADIRGTEAVATVPVADRLVNELIARDLPPTAPVRQVVVQSEAGNRIRARVTLKVGFMPALNVTATIDQQPALPDSPVLGLRLSGLGGLMGLAAGAVSNMLPPGVTLEGERALVNLHTLLEERGGAGLLDHVQDLFVTTQDGCIVVAFKLHVR